MEDELRQLSDKDVWEVVSRELADKILPSNSTVQS